MNNTSIRTISKLIIDFNNPDPAEIYPKDIASGLSKICRFSGQIPVFYSVAEHCYHIWEIAKDISSDHALYALLHDASEAYMCDISTPLKTLLPEYRKIEKRLTKAILDSFDFFPSDQVKADIKEIDLRMLKTEAKEFGMNVDNEEWSHISAPVYPDIKFYYFSCYGAETRYLKAMYESFSKVKDEYIDCMIQVFR